MLDDLKALWEISFGDDKRYVDFYFSRRYRPENTRAVWADGRVVSAAQFFPYTVLYKGEFLDGVYILGVCTHPDYRREGHAAKVIKSILAEQYAKGVELAFLIAAEPYLFDVYGKYGFGRLFKIHETHVIAERTSGGGSILNDAPLRAVYEFYDEFYRSLDSAVMKSYSDFVFAVDEVCAAGGSIAACGRENGICGFAAFEDGVVKELLCEDALARDKILSYFSADSGLMDSGLTVITPRAEEGSAEKTIGMARVLRPASFLEKTAKEPVAIRLTDSLIPQNSGVYTIRDGITFSETGEFDISLDVSELPGYFMQSSYANLLLN